MKLKFHNLGMSFPGEGLIAQIVATDVAHNLVGTITVIMDGNLAEFTRLWVHPGRRRRGIARALLKHVIERAREKRVESVSCQVHVSNRPVIAFYRAMGLFTACTLTSGLLLMAIRTNRQNNPP